MFETSVLDYDSILHVADNLREPDRHEINAGRGGEDDWEELADYCMRNTSFGWLAKVDGEPVAVFCAAHFRLGHWQLHRYATNRWPEVSYSTAKVVKSEFLPLLRHGVSAERVQYASIDGNTDIRSWIEWCGFHREEDLPGAGKDGETFVQFAKVWRH